MKLLLIICTSFIVQQTFGQYDVEVGWTKSSDIPASAAIYYTPGTKLEWKAFRGMPESTGTTAALTVSGFGYKADMSHSANQGSLRIRVYCYFDQTKSWVRPDKKSEYVLNHEQRHYDISYLAAAQFVYKLKRAAINQQNVDDRIAEIYTACTKWMNDMQDAYDGQTRNGINKDMQDQWNQKIDKMLQALTD